MTAWFVERYRSTASTTPAGSSRTGSERIPDIRTAGEDRHRNAELLDRRLMACGQKGDD